MLKISVLFFSFLISTSIYAQNSLLDQLETTDDAETKVAATFKSFKIVNLETPKLVSKKHLNFVVAHRFGSIKNGYEDLFGLDFANTRLLFTYGLTDKINVSFARSRFGNP